MIFICISSLPSLSVVADVFMLQFRLCCRSSFHCLLAFFILSFALFMLHSPGGMLTYLLTKPLDEIEIIWLCVNFKSARKWAANCWLDFDKKLRFYNVTEVFMVVFFGFCELEERFCSWRITPQPWTAFPRTFWWRKIR